jgi:hypothetical protein
MQHHPSSASKGTKQGLNELKESLVSKRRIAREEVVSSSLLFLRSCQIRTVDGVSEKPKKSLEEKGKRAAAKEFAKGVVG